jgi:ABC-2 type transport system ATP-binding protein
VFVSSHLMSEMALTADHLIVVGRGRLIADMSVDDFVRRASGNIVHVRSPQAEELRGRLVAAPDVTVTVIAPGLLEVSGLSAPQIGETAARHGFVLHELMPQQVSLEEAFMELTRDDVEFKAGVEPAATTEAAA